jgi:cytochrome P450
MANAVRLMLEGWSTKEGKAFDIHEEMMRVTLRIVAETLFSVTIDDRTSEVAKAFAAANEHADAFTKAMFLMPSWIPTPRNLSVKRTLRTLGSLVERIIEDHRSLERADLLTMLMAARDDETGERMSDHQLHDEILTMTAAGHETTANLLTWCFYLLADHPAVEEMLHAEVSAVLGDRTPQLADLAKLNYTNWVLQETMRLYPPVWNFERQAIADDEVLGYHITAGSSMVIFVFGVHRHERHWENPNEFRPDRFSPPQSETRHRTCYLPFSTGPRRCIGNNYAMMEAQIVLAMIVQRYRLRMVANHPVELEPLITLRPRYGVRVTAESRSVSRDQDGNVVAQSHSAD